MKLEMKIEKGLNFFDVNDVNKLINLYTQAIEHYYIAGDEDTRKYYEKKLKLLLESPSAKKTYTKKEEPKEAAVEETKEEELEIKPKKTMKEMKSL